MRFEIQTWKSNIIYKTGFWVGCNIITSYGGRQTILIETTADIPH